MITYCLGMMGSGSTWLYNVVREIFETNGVKYAAYTAEEYQHLDDDRLIGAKNAILRGHNIDSYFLRLLELTQSKAVLSFRDPRDAVASCMQRFNRHPIPVIADISRNLASLISAADALSNISFFYEDHFSEASETVAACSRFLDLPLSPSDIDQIMNRYSVEAVRSLSARLNGDHNAYFDPRTERWTDELTGFNSAHISDTRVGKWSDVVPVELQPAVQDTFAGYLTFLQQHHSLISGRDNNTAFQCSHRSRETAEEVEQLSLVFSHEIFAPRTRNEIVAEQLSCRAAFDGARMKVLDLIFLPRGWWHVRIVITPGPQLNRVVVSQHGERLYAEDVGSDGPSVEFQFLNRLNNEAIDVNILYEGMETDAARDAPLPSAMLLAKKIL